MAWYEQSFRRNLVDMHIERTAPAFLREFDENAYFECLKKGKIQSPMIYLQSHVGLCYWPTASGYEHPAMRGGKIRHLIDLCHGAGMDVIGYYSLIYNNQTYRDHPEWRALNVDERGTRERGSGRYGICCPNNKDYRGFVREQLAEVFAEFPMEGIFLDMTFWPLACYCPDCQMRFYERTGRRIPETVDWNDPLWREFIDARREWMNEFAEYATGLVRELAPGVSVEHQFSTIAHAWSYGVDHGVGDASDYAGGDLYGGFHQQAYISKLYYEATRNHPFEYMTCRCDPSLNIHTTGKSLDEMRQHNLLTVAHHGAFLVIDAIDPVGTIDPRAYETIGRMFEESIPYEKYMARGKLSADVAIYHSYRSNFDPDEKGIRPDRTRGNMADNVTYHLASCLGAAASFKYGHIPYTVIPDNRPEKLSEHRAVVISQAFWLTEGQVEDLYRYVEDGGSLYISGRTDPKLLRRLLGVELDGMTPSQVTYLAPAAGKEDWFLGEYSEKYPLTHLKALPRIVAHGAEVLAHVALPYTDPADRTAFASIHSNPPGPVTELPALLLKRVGKGKALYCAAPLEQDKQQLHRAIFRHWIEALLGGDAQVRTDAPQPVEIVLYEEENGVLVNCVNAQEVLPALPLYPFSVAVRTGRPAKAVRRLPEEAEIPFRQDGAYCRFDVCKIDLLAMFSIELA